MTATSEPTPSQTVGPFFAFGLPFDGGGDVVPPGTAGAISLHGTVRDGAGAPVPDALLEFWQAGPDGRLPTRGGSLARDGRSFTGFARVPTDRAGDYSVRTLRPAAVAGSPDAPHLAVTVFARGLLHHLFTRVYLPNHADANATDPLLASLPAERAAHAGGHSRRVVRRAGVPLRRPAAGRGGDGVPGADRRRGAAGLDRPR